MRTVFYILMVMLLPSMAWAFDFGQLLDPSSPYILLLVMALEFVLGKTDWVKANSTVELVLNLILKFFKKDEKL